MCPLSDVICSSDIIGPLFLAMTSDSLGTSLVTTTTKQKGVKMKWNHRRCDCYEVRERKFSGGEEGEADAMKELQIIKNLAKQ